MAVRIVVHGHFYQPPRENPWTGRIDPQPDAAPFADWNERVHAESYGPNTAVKVPSDGGERTVNNFERMSFDIGPTLMAWLEIAQPDTYEMIIEADHASIERLGHGNAMAQAFHHTILPLSTVRDIRTQVRWGLTDFLRRFERDAEGMWLPEAAVNDAVLSVLIEEGVAFTVLAPHQALAWRGPADVGWTTTASSPIDTRIPYRYEHMDGSGRWIAIFFYDGDLARDIAFNNLASDASVLLDAFQERASGSDDGIVHAAADGETYGHHQRFAEIGLAFALFEEAERRGIEVTNYAAQLAAHPPEDLVRIKRGEGTSWSCSHGVSRWMRDCGCSTYGPSGWNQEWRAPCVPAWK